MQLTEALLFEMLGRLYAAKELLLLEVQALQAAQSQAAAQGQLSEPVGKGAAEKKAT